MSKEHSGTVSIWRWCLVLLVSSIPCIAGCTAKEMAEGAERDEPAAPVPVRVAQVQRTTLLPSIDVVGTVIAIPERTAVITAQTNGQIETVSVVEGAPVSSGQCILQLDTLAAEAQRRRAEAVVQHQQAVLDRLRNGFRPQEIEIARQEALRAKANLEASRLRVEAMAILRNSNEISDTEFKKLQTLLRRDEAAYESARANLELHESGTRAEAIAAAQAQLDVAQSELIEARLEVEFCTLKSPIDGVVTKLLARTGAHVALSDQLATVADLSQVFVLIRIPSGFLSRVKPDARVQAELSSRPQEPIEGQVTRFSGEADPNTGDVRAFATLRNVDGFLRPGLGCRVRVWLPPIENAIAVPNSAVAYRDGTSVLHVVRDGKAYEVEVTVGVETQGLVQITNGLRPDDLVITEGGYGLPDGCPVSSNWL